MSFICIRPTAGKACGKLHTHHKSEEKRMETENIQPEEINTLDEGGRGGQ